MIIDMENILNSSNISSRSFESSQKEAKLMDK
jgi:hypothetical protein